MTTKSLRVKRQVIWLGISWTRWRPRTTSLHVHQSYPEQNQRTYGAIAVHQTHGDTIDAHQNKGMFNPTQ
jgi:hypothetical protein